MLAQHGPWQHHVEIFGSTNYFEAIDWLSQNGHKHLASYEVIEPKVGVGTKKDMTTDRQKMKFIFLFNEPSLASYIKMVWG